MNATDLAYTAGIVDGEGCISINFKKNDNRCQLMLKVAMHDPDVPNWLSETFGGKVYSGWQNSKLAKNSYNYIWSKYGKSAQDLLISLLPYIKEKRPHILIAVELPIKDVGERLSDWERNKQIELAHKIARFQKKGGKGYVPEAVR